MLMIVDYHLHQVSSLDHQVETRFSDWPQHAGHKSNLALGHQALESRQQLLLNFYYSFWSYQAIVSYASPVLMNILLKKNRSFV